VSDTNDLVALRDRILLPFQIRRGSNVWAPWGISGWSAIEIVKPSRKWAQGYRVKPATNERGSLGKLPLDRLLKRDPKLLGKDKPGPSPDEVFAHMVKEEPKPAPPPPPPPPPPPTVPTEVAKPAKPLSEKARLKRIQHLLDLFSEMSTLDDW
jgi:hypothetical protein